MPQVGSVHEQLGRPTPFLLRYAWVAGHGGSPSSAAPAASQSASASKRLPTPEVEQVSSAVEDADHHGAISAPASSWTGTSHPAAPAASEVSTGHVGVGGCQTAAAVNGVAEQVPCWV